MGVRYMASGLKVYYLPVLPFYNMSALPTIVASLPLFRHIMLVEDVDVVHGHSAFSTLAQESIFIGGALDCRRREEGSLIRKKDDKNLTSTKDEKNPERNFVRRRVATVFTDHSLFGFADASAVVTNTFLRFSLANADECICVSHVGKENTVLRSSVPAERVSVIPNAVDCGLFRPNFSRPMPHETEVKNLFCSSI